MAAIEMFELGRVLKPHGLKGDVAVRFDVDNPNRYAGLDMVWMAHRGALVPYTISWIAIRPKSTVIHFEGVDSADAVAAMVECTLHLPVDMLPPLRGLQFYFHEVLGFSLFTVQGRDLGEIKGVIDHAANPLFKTMLGEKEGLFPMSDPFLIEVNRAERQIVVDLPEGMAELYFD